MSFKLLSLETPKIDKSNKISSEYLTAILHIAPNSISGINVCKFATPACIEHCLFGAGMARVFPKINEARTIKGIHFANNSKGFIHQLNYEIKAHALYAESFLKMSAIRPNGTSDLLYERLLDMESFKTTQFYDYTKYPYHLRPTEKLAKNYHLTFSRTEKTTKKEIFDNISQGRNVATVFDQKLPMPKTYLGIPVIDGTTHDIRFKDVQGVIVGLKALGTMIYDQTGFVMRDESKLTRYESIAV